MKTHKITFGDRKLESAFNSLSDKDPTKKGLTKAIREIKNDFKAGRLITKDTHNKSKIKNLLNKHKTSNIRVYNLPTAWRMLYSITRTEDIKILAVILDWMSHKDYEKLLR